MIITMLDISKFGELVSVLFKFSYELWKKQKRKIKYKNKMQNISTLTSPFS